MRLKEPIEHRLVVLAREEVLELELEDLPGAGYLWSIEVTGPLRVEEPGWPSEDEIAAGGVGGGVRRVWRIMPTGAGGGTVRGRRGQSWDLSHADREVTLTVDITDRT